MTDPVALVKTGTRIVASEAHVYYIATDNRIYDNVWDGSRWQGGSFPLNANGPSVRPGSALANDGDVLYFVGTDNRLYVLQWTAAAGWQTKLLVPTQIPVRDGTDVVLHMPHIYYVSTNNNICDVVLNGGTWQGGQQLVWSQATNVKVGTQIIVTDTHVYYVATDDQIYDNVWNGTAWQGGDLPLDVNAPKVKPGTRVANDRDHLFYVSANDKIHELIWKNGWRGGEVSTPSPSESVRSGTDLLYFDSHVYYVSAKQNRVCDLVWNDTTGWTAGVLNASSAAVGPNTQLLAWSNIIYEEGSPSVTFRSHHVFYIGADSRVHYLIYDDARQPYRAPACLDPDDMNHDGHGFQDPASGYATTGEDCSVCKTNGISLKEWYYGRLNPTAASVLSGSDLAGYGKHFFFVGSDRRIHDFLRGVVNGAANNTWGAPSFYDEFAELDLTKWRMTFLWGNHAPNACYDFYWNAEQNVTVDSGKLKIKAEQLNPPGLRTNVVTWPAISYTKPYSYQTGMINSEQLFSQTYGYFEVRSKAPRGKYFWPSFWLAGPGGEIDVFEMDGNGKSLIGTPHFNNKWVPSVVAYAVGYRFYDDYYTYAVEWTANSITWYLNNEPIGSTVNYSIHQPLNILATLELHDANGACEISNLPALFEIEYIRAYKW